MIEELLDFFASSPTPAQIQAFKVSLKTQARLEELLDTQRDDGLTVEEAAELDTCSWINHVLLLLKAQTYTTYQGNGAIP